MEALARTGPAAPAPRTATPPQAPPDPDPAQAAHAEYLARRHFPDLDGMRGVSIVAVVWHHAGAHTGLAGRGYLGVELFFAISGFLITTLLLRERARTGTVSLPGFYLRRTLRIFPLYYAVLAAYVLLVALLERGPAGQEFFGNLPAYATYTSNWFVGLESGPRVIFYFAWSLATEEQFYLVWPLVLRFARRGWVPPAVLALSLLADQGAEAAVALGLVDAGPLPVRVVRSIAPAICLGCLGAWVLDRPRGFALAWKVAGNPFAAPAAAALLLGVLLFESTPRLAIEASMALLVLACCIRPWHPLRPVLGNPVVRYVGSISYGMYLMHMLAMNGARRVVSGAALFPVALLLTVLLASLSWRFFERWFLRLKERLG